MVFVIYGAQQEGKGAVNCDRGLMAFNRVRLPPPATERLSRYSKPSPLPDSCPTGSRCIFTNSSSHSAFDVAS